MPALLREVSSPDGAGNFLLTEGNERSLPLSSGERKPAGSGQVGKGHGLPCLARTPPCDPWPFTYLLPGGMQWLSGAWGSDCIDHVGPPGLRTGRRVGGVEALHLPRTPLDKLRLVT